MNTIKKLGLFIDMATLSGYRYTVVLYRYSFNKLNIKVIVKNSRKSKKEKLLWL